MSRSGGSVLGRRRPVIAQIGILAGRNIFAFVKNAMRYLVMVNGQHTGFRFCPKEG